jgi:hypothetical protein
MQLTLPQQLVRPLTVTKTIESHKLEIAQMANRPNRSKSRNIKIIGRWFDADGVEHEQVLEMDDIIFVSRFETAFAYSQAPGAHIEMTVQEALDNDVFNTQRGTMTVDAHLKLENGKHGGVWARYP